MNIENKNNIEKIVNEKSEKNKKKDGKGFLKFMIKPTIIGVLAGIGLHEGGKHINNIGAEKTKDKIGTESLADTQELEEQKQEMAQDLAQKIEKRQKEVKEDNIVVEPQENNIATENPIMMEENQKEEASATSEFADELAERTEIRKRNYKIFVEVRDELKQMNFENLLSRLKPLLHSIHEDWRWKEDFSLDNNDLLISNSDTFKDENEFRNTQEANMISQMLAKEAVANQEEANKILEIIGKQSAFGKFINHQVNRHNFNG
jgi:hypothetical protein